VKVAVSVSNGGLMHSRFQTGLDLAGSYKVEESFAHGRVELQTDEKFGGF
jgi:hypothetical protein